LGGPQLEEQKTNAQKMGHVPAKSKNVHGHVAATVAATVAAAG